MIDVYIALLPTQESSVPLFCGERQAEIDSISNERVRREKYYVWKLLEYAIKNSLGADASRLCFKKNENGKWFCDGFEFSLSHSGDVLAVVVSKSAVGVDVERIRVKNSERMSNYILTKSELEKYNSICEEEREAWLIQKWCQKEAIFKFQNKNSFSASEIETEKFFSCVKNFEIKNEKYILALAADNEDNVKIFENIDVF